MERKEVLESSEYWTAKAQVELYNQAQKFMNEKNMNRSQFAAYLGVSKGYVSQLLNGDFDHRMSKFFELALAFGVVPQINFIPVEQYIKEDNCQIRNVALCPPQVYKWTPATENVASSAVWDSVDVCEPMFDTPKKTA